MDKGKRGIYREEELIRESNTPSWRLDFIELVESLSRPQAFRFIRGSVAGKKKGGTREYRENWPDDAHR